MGAAESHDRAVERFQARCLLGRAMAEAERLAALIEYVSTWPIDPLPSPVVEAVAALRDLEALVRRQENALRAALAGQDDGEDAADGFEAEFRAVETEIALLRPRLAAAGRALGPLRAMFVSEDGAA